MRRWLLVFMVLLLPLRGWVGEAMAGEMLRQQMGVSVPAAHGHDCDHHGDAQTGHHAAHDGHAAHDDHAQQHGQPPSTDDCPTCAACQVCSSVAMWPPLPVVTTTSFHHPPPSHVQRAFTSAEPALAFKPPRG